MFLLFCEVGMCDRCGKDGNDEVCDSCSMIEAMQNKRRLQLVAPKMLEALRAALSWIERDEEIHGRTFHCGVICRDAIQLATGKRPVSQFESK
jgi:hypothetical protein